MYNEDIKKSFIDDYYKNCSLSRREACVYAFNAVEPVEEGCGADLCTLSGGDLEEAIKLVVGLRASSSSLGVSICRSYVRWCIEHDVDGACDDLLKMKLKNIKLNSMRTRMVFSPADLQEYLDALFEKESEYTVDTIFRCYYWLAYAGMDEEDVFRIERGNVDIENMAVVYNGEEYPIYREGLMAVMNSATRLAFRYKNSAYTPGKQITLRDRLPGEKLVRGIRGDGSPISFRVNIAKKSRIAEKEGKTDRRLSYKRIWLSGLFYRIYRGEQSGIPADFTEVAERLIEKSVENGADPDGIAIRQKRRRMMHDFRLDYERWKSEVEEMK